MKADVLRKSVAEFLGTAMLLAAVVGSGIMAERLSGGNDGVALLANTIATGSALVALILTLGPVSGAHFNPAVTLANFLDGGMGWRDAALYVIAQLAGAVLGVAAANFMFGLPLFFTSTKVRTGVSLWLGEFIATAGLIAVIFGCSKHRNKIVVPLAVATWIVAASWFTSSTSFANPAVTLARSLSDTFAGIRPVDVQAFVLIQLGAATAATYVSRWLFQSGDQELIVPHE